MRNLNGTKWQSQLENICRCECHNEGIQVMHCIPCCDFTYQKYQTSDGKLKLNIIYKMLENKDLVKNIAHITPVLNIKG